MRLSKIELEVLCDTVTERARAYNAKQLKLIKKDKTIQQQVSRIYNDLQSVAPETRKFVRIYGLRAIKRALTKRALNKRAKTIPWSGYLKGTITRLALDCETIDQVRARIDKLNPFNFHKRRR